MHNIRHPAEMGEPEINAFLTHLAGDEWLLANRVKQRQLARSRQLLGVRPPPTAGERPSPAATFLEMPCARQGDLLSGLPPPGYCRLAAPAQLSNGPPARPGNRPLPGSLRGFLLLPLPDTIPKTNPPEAPSGSAAQFNRVSSVIAPRRRDKTLYVTLYVIREEAEFVHIAERLEGIEQWLQTYRPDYHALLEPPASDDALRSAEQRFDVELSLAFKSLYRWHGGQRPRNFTPLLYNLTFMTLPEIIEAKETLDHVARFDQWERDSWWPNWIPFLDNGGGDHLCFDLGGFKTGNTEQLLWFDHETHEHEIVHSSRRWTPIVGQQMGLFKV